MKIFIGTYCVLFIYFFIVVMNAGIVQIGIWLMFLAGLKGLQKFLIMLLSIQFASE